jgi:bifunctional non-homologous end joining protein LigD
VLHQPITAAGFIAPMLPTMAAEPPTGDQWQHEIKYDGYRTLIRIWREERAFTRNGHDWSDTYRSILRAARSLKCISAAIDGEVIVQDAQGRSDFPALRSSMSSHPERLIFYAFDLLELDGRDLRALPLIDRRDHLRDLIGSHNPHACIQFSDHVIGSGDALFASANAMGLEGIVSKKVRSKYRSGKTTSWLKIKCFAEGEFVVIGIDRTETIPVVLLARETEDGLEYAGGAMITLAGKDREAFVDAVGRLKQDRAPIRMVKRPGARWMRPEVRVRVKYLKGSDKLRHASLLGLVR